MEDDFSNKSVWRKQVSQDGREYYVNLVSGIIKYPPKQPEKKADNVDVKKSQVDEHYIQQYTVDKVPFFVNMRSGVSSWTLPEGTALSAVKYITHLTAEGIPYYEDTEKKTTSWTLPVEKLSTSARRSSVALVKMNRRQSNIFMEQQETSESQNQADTSHDYEEGEDGRSGGESGLFKPRPRNRTGSRTGINKSGTQPRRYSNMAQKSQQNLARSSTPPRESANQKVAGGLADVRSIRANQRQQSISRLQPDTDNAGSGNEDALASRKPFSNETIRDSPTISDVSSVTAPSAHPPNQLHNSHLPHDSSTPILGETKPLVRQVFEKYEKNKCGCITLSNLQELCYDFGTYLSEDELHTAISEIDMDRDGRLTYEEFMVWWRTNDQFSTMKLSDAHTKLRTDCAAVFKRYDRKMEGQVSRQEFAKVHRELVREKLVKLDLDTCVSILDSKGDGIVYFNDFITWVERGQVPHSVSKNTGPAEPIQRQKSLAKFFGSFLGGSQEPDSKSTVVENLVPVKEHPDYAKYFRMASVGGNVMDIRRQMREAGLDENLIHTPEKMISAISQQAQSDHLKQATIIKTENAAFGSYSNIAESAPEKDSDSIHVDDRTFTSMFKKKSQTTQSEEPAVGSSLVEVFLSKPLGITLGENVEDEEKGVHVSSCTAGGNAANTGLIEPGMILLEACGQDVRFKDFDSVMDILRSAPAGEKIKLVFSKNGELAAQDGPGDSDVSETSSVEKSIVHQESTNLDIHATLEPNDTDVSETSSLDKSIVLQSQQHLIERKPSIQVALEPNDTDVSETSSVDRSVAGKRSISSTMSKVFEEPSTVERRDSLKSVGSVHSLQSQSSHVSRNSVDNEDAKRDNHANDEPPVSLNLKARTSFASRKAAAIRNAATRKRGNSFVQNDHCNDLVSDDGSAAVAVTSQPIIPSRGVFGLQNPYDSDPDDAPPILPHSELDTSEKEDWRNNEPVVSIPNPQSVSTHHQAPAELENSQIIGRPRGPKRHLPTILSRMRRQQSGESKPERGGIARMSSKSIEDIPSPRELHEDSPTLSNNNSLAMADMGTTGSAKVPIPVALLGISSEVRDDKSVASRASDHSHKNDKCEVRDDKSVASRASDHSHKNDNGSLHSDRSNLRHHADLIAQDCPAQDTESTHSQSKPNVVSKRESPEDFTTTRRATAMGRHIRGMRSFVSKQALKTDHDTPVTENSPIPTPKLVSKVRRDNLLIQGRDSDHESDSSGFSPQQIKKTIGTFSPNWNNSPPSIPKLGSNYSHSTEVSESETSYSQYRGVPFQTSTTNSRRQQVPVQSQVPVRSQVPHQSHGSRIKMLDVGVQSDYAAYIDEQYLNSYQMLLGERQQLDYAREMFQVECEESLEMLREEELSLSERIRLREAESFQRIHYEEERLTARVREVEDIIMNEKEEIMRQWQELHHAEMEAHETHRQKTTELLELMHIVRAHHDKLQADKKKIGRQRLQLDMALQDLNKFNHFNPHQSSPSDLKSSSHRRGLAHSPHQPYSPGMTISSARRAVSPSPYSTSHSSNIPWNNSPSRAPSRDRSYGSTR